MAHASWAPALLTTVALQWSVVAGISAVMWLVAGQVGAISCLAGGSAVALPNAVLAAYLALKARHARVLSATTFLAGEMVKLMCTCAALYLAVRGLQPPINWLALIAGVIGALKAQWLAVWFTRNQ